MLPNDPYSTSPKYLEKNSHSLKFDGYKTRPDISKSNNININDSRFESINKNPDILSRSKRVPGVSFKHSTARGELYKPSKDNNSNFYTPQKENTMGRLDKGVASFAKSPDREPKGGLGMRASPETSYNYTNAIEAKTKTTRSRVTSLTNFGKEPARDDLMMRQTEAYRLIKLDNSKEERQLELNARKTRRQSMPSSVLMNA